MSRPKIGAVAAGVMAVLTVAAALLASHKLDASLHADVEARVSRAQGLLTQIGSLEAFDIIARAQSFSRDPQVRTAIVDPAASAQAGKAALARLLSTLGGATRPDFVAIVDAKGKVVIADSPLPDSDDLKSRQKAVAAALDAGQVSKDVWNYGKNTERVGVAPVLGDDGRPVGAVVVAFALSAKEAQSNAEIVGTDVVFFSGDRVVASSMKRQPFDDLNKVPALKQLAADALAGKQTPPVSVDVGGEAYMAAAAPLPLSFSDRSSGALVLGPLAHGGAAGAVVAIIIVLGALAIVMTLVAIFVTSRMILHQSDEIEAGVAEIINGDVDYTFKPVGADLDGMANSLNVMLARMLGRPEPGDEPLDESGAGVVPAKVHLDEAEGARAASDADALALAREPEGDYLRRVHQEFVAARRAVGESVEGVTFESFSAKLRLSEANLKKKYGCKAVRFKVQTKNNQVTLKPVPIV